MQIKYLGKYSPLESRLSHSPEQTDTFTVKDQN